MVEVAGLGPARKASLADQVYDGLKEALALGEFAPGTRLTNDAVAGLFGVSTTPVREALQRLVSEGLLEGAAGGVLAVPLADEISVRRMMDVVAVMEGLAAERAAAHFSRADQMAARAALKAMRAAFADGDRRATLKARRDLVHALYAPADNPLLMRQIETFNVMLGPLIGALLPAFANSAQRRRLEALLKALAAGEGAAARALAHDIAAGNRDIIVAALGRQSGREARRA